MFFIKERQKNKTKQVILKQQKLIGFADLLGYLVMLDDHTIIHKDGALSRHFRYIAPDLESSTSHDLDFHSETWARSFQFLGDGWMVETNVASQPFGEALKTREFPECVSALLDDERRLQYQGAGYFKTTYYLSMTWKPDERMVSWVKRFMLDKEETGHSKSDSLNEALRYFNKTIFEYTGFLKRSLVLLEPLVHDELTTYLHYCITGSPYRLKKPSQGAYLHCYLAQDFTGNFEPTIAGKYIKVLSIDDVPTQSFPCLLDALSQCPLSYRWSSRFVCLDKMSANAYLKRIERNWSSKAIGLMGILRESMGLAPKRDLDAQRTADEIKEAQHHNASGERCFGFYNSQLILIHHDRDFLQEASDAIMNRIQQMDFKIREEWANAVEAYLGSLPCHGGYNIRKMLQESSFVSHVFPTSSVYQGEHLAPCELAGYKKNGPLLMTTTQGSRPFLLNLHVGDVGHTAILGPTGSGKSTLIGALMSAHRQYRGSRLIVLDKDGSNRLIVKALGGSYYDLGRKECQLAPLHRVEKDNDVTLDKAVSWLRACCEIQGIQMTPERQRFLRDAVNRLASDAPQYKNLDHLIVQEPHLREALSTLNQGQFHYLLNGTNSFFHDNAILGFEMGSLIQTQVKDNDPTITVIQAIFHELDILFQDRRPTLLILEEAWLYLKHPLFQHKLVDWFKTLRKLNVSVLFVSQDLADIVQSEAHSAIQSSCMTRIFLPNQSAKEKAIRQHYEAFGLNERQIELISQATPKQDYYYQSPLGRRLFQLDLQEVARSFLCVSDKADIDHFDHVYQSDKPQWILDWLSYKKCPQWVDFIKQHYLGDRLCS